MNLDITIDGINYNLTTINKAIPKQKPISNFSLNTDINTDIQKMWIIITNKPTSLTEVKTLYRKFQYDTFINIDTHLQKNFKNCNIPEMFLSYHNKHQ